MKILLVVPSFYDKNYKGVNKSNTGQAVIVGDICRNFSDAVNTDILITGKPQKGLNLGYATILSTSLGSLLRNFRLKNLKYIKFKGSLKQRLKSVFAVFMRSQAEFYLKSKKYDIVAIHDFNECNMEMLKLCQSIGIKTVVTLHIYIGSDPYLINSSYRFGLIGEEFLLEKTDVPITVVSSGLKKRILQDHNYIAPDRITVIPNGTSLLKSEKNDIEDKNLKDKFGSKKIFLCIGTVGSRKNQIQLVRSLKLLDDNIRSQIKVLFIGVDMLNGELQKMIADEKLDDVAEYIGALPQKEVEKYYNSAFAVISTSLNEAFGLIFIEGFCYGLPSIYFYDIDSADDLYSPDAVEMINNKDDKSVAYTITKALSRTWDRDKIKQYSQKFYIKRIAELYENKYKEIADTDR